MNLLRKQGFFNSVTLYIGVALGFFNSIILFQRYLTLEEIGYFTLLITISVIYTQLSSLGFTNVITRYFPFHKTEDKTHGGFLSFVLIACLIGFSIVTAGFIFFKELLFSLYGNKAGVSLMSELYYYVIPISFLTLIFLIQETLARTIFKSIVPTFLREVLVKVFTSIGIVLIMFRVMDFKDFINFYLITNLLIVLLITWYIYRLKIGKPSSITPEVRANIKTMTGYGLFSMIAGSAVAIIPGLGLVLLKLISGEAMVGIYGTFFGIAAVISLPAKALNTTSYQIIADAWKNEDQDKIRNIYKKTSIVQLVIGLLLLIGLIINQRNILFLLHKPEYANYFNVFILLGVGCLIDITGGLNGAIISFSKYYKVVVRFLSVATILSAILNYGFISKLGILGAAWSHVGIMLMINFGYWLYLKLKFRMQPFGIKHLLCLVVGGLCLTLGLFLPDLTNFYLDVFYRSLLIGSLYLSSIYFLNISEDINDLIDNVLMKKLR
ncbi:MAG TPA: hypothetical protein VGB63_18910 [Pedobacter sp.]|jgi:O-antigen/teichoic acid export membrane protein